MKLNCIIVRGDLSHWRVAGDLHDAIEESSVDRW